MNNGLDVPERRAAALRLLRDLREVDSRTGVKNSRIAFDIAMMFYEEAIRDPGAELSVDQIAAASGYSGPTIRLVLKRLLGIEAIGLARRLGKTQLYRITPLGAAGFDGYIEAILGFRAP